MAADGDGDGADVGVSGGGAAATVTERVEVLKGIAQECIEEDELELLLRGKPHPVCYDGFEPSGRMHIAQGIVKVINVNKMVKAGCHVKIWIADWFALLNNKLGGDLDKIQAAGRRMIDVWTAFGMDPHRVQFLWSSTEISKHADVYWPLVMDIARRTSMRRIRKCGPIMGRSEHDQLNAAQILYPCMQCADIFFLKADICQMGMDQRKVNMLAREYCDDIKKKNKPIILSHRMLRGLKEGQEKMSKSDPSSAIFMDDKEHEVNSKIDQAFCPPIIVEGNPCLEYIEYIVFPWFEKFEVIHDADHGFSKTYTRMEDLVDDYRNGALCPSDLKAALMKAINQILKPVCDHFETKPEVDITVDACDATVSDTSVATNTATVADDYTLDGESLSVEERLEMLRSIAEECTSEDELQWLLQNKSAPICYDGFEPSGRMHIADGILKAINVNKLVKAGCKVKIWIADWFALLNNKLGGNLKKIETVGRYMIEVWKAIGMNHDGVEFLWSSSEINSRADEYWPRVMDIATRNSIEKIMSCCHTMGLSEHGEVKMTAAQILYPCMQCADIFFLEADICQMGIDQREVNKLAREYSDIKNEKKPIILSHHLLPGLKEGQDKMSTSDPSSAIFMDDDKAEVDSKIKRAFCPPKIVKGNPCLEYIKYIIFPWFGKFEVVRKAENGGNKTFMSVEELVMDYESGALHPSDVKPALKEAINQILKPVRDHFENNKEAKILRDTVKGYIKFSK